MNLFFFNIRINVIFFFSISIKIDYYLEILIEDNLNVKNNKYSFLII